MYYRVCPKCGAALDPAEHCDCEEERARERKMENERMERLYIKENKSNQIAFNLERMGAR